MAASLVAVLDVGKTLAKLTLWDRAGRLVARRTRPNARIDAGDWLALDAGGIEAWMTEGLADFARAGRIGAIVPVAHGAAAAVLKDGRLACPPIDYEDPMPAAELAAYRAGRDPFAETGSPALPDGLNVGAQLHRIAARRPEALGPGALILPWAQYWAWRLSGVAASEATSLGCHTDLWRPRAGAPSGMARARGWAELFAPLRRAGEVLGPVAREWVERCGLPAEAQVWCGLHDSNAALLAARADPAVGEGEASVLATGTWFVAMRTPGAGAATDWSRLDEGRDCLVNVDVAGRPIPSARFMGGREIERLLGAEARLAGAAADADLAAAGRVVRGRAMALPTFTPGVGPFPDARGGWLGAPADEAERRAAVALYAALVSAAMLERIGARGVLAIEGRFAEAAVFVRALAALRPDLAVFAGGAEADVSFGALRLAAPEAAPAGSLRRAEPLDIDLAAYAAEWRARAEAGAAQTAGA